MKRIAMIKDGVVQNVALWDGVSPWDPAGFVLIDVTAQPDVAVGWTYDGINFLAPI